MKTITIPVAVDLHVHFREPSNNKAETIKSGSRGALLGGYGLVCDMPNNPGNPTWSEAKIDEKQAIIKKDSLIPMATYAGSQPDSDNLNELAAMSKKSIGLKLYGAATTGNHVDYEPGDFEAIIERWHKIAPTKPIMLHSGRDNLAGFIELIAKKHEHPLHVCHLFSVEQAKLARKAQRSGLPVTSGVCPHHIFKTSHHAITEGWFARMQPPLMRQDEAEELFELFAAGQIDALETDHAPHSLESKWAAEQANPEGIHDPDHATCYGVPGIEFALPLLFYQMQKGKISLDRIIEATSAAPARIIGVKLSADSKTTWNMDMYRIGDSQLAGSSGSGWTPYLNNIAVGRLKNLSLSRKTLVSDGKIVAKMPRVIGRGDSV